MDVKIDLDEKQSVEIMDYDNQTENAVSGVTVEKKTPIEADISADEDDKKGVDTGKQPSQSTIDSAFSDMNSKIKMQKTRCEYSYDEPTRRISIKIFDKETDELIKEVPPEKSLEMLQKVWELAGLIVDTKL